MKNGRMNGDPKCPKEESLIEAGVPDRVYLNTVHRDWCETTILALTTQRSATRRQLIAQTQRLEQASIESTGKELS